jgi:Zn finger protein HypA/HybF involved in hydrogenase expression
MAIKLTQDEFIKKAKTIHGEKYIYDNVKYIGALIKIIIKCPSHGEFEQPPNNHLNGRGCPDCGKENRKITQEEFINKASIKHNSRYIYSLTNYINIKTKIKIICPDHGVFEQSPDGHLHGQGCPKCDGKNKSTNDFKMETTKIHGNKYDYSLVEYINNENKIKITCPDHGVFEQPPHNHLKGQGCPICSNNNLLKTRETFIQDAKSIHGDKYNYSLVIYTNNKIKVKIICPKHGEFIQRPSTHLSGSGCPTCGQNSSKIETSWLNHLGISEENRHIRILNYIVDGFDPDTNTIYEFNGDFWHGNPLIYNHQATNPKNRKTYGQLYEDTLVRESILNFNGYTVISIWESDWKNQSRSQRKK